MNTDPARLRPAYVAYQVAARYLGNAERAQMATLTRPEHCAASRPCWKRFAPRSEWLVSHVAFQRGDRRSSVLWNQTDQALAVSLPRWGSRAVAVDKYGQETPLEAQGDRWVVMLSPAFRRMDLFGGDPPGYFYVGGSPLIVVEYWSTASRPTPPSPRRAAPPRPTG